MDNIKTIIGNDLESFTDKEKELFFKILSEYKDKLNEMLLENSFGYYDKLSELFEIIPTCLREGINFNDQNIKFNMLDFAYLTKEEPQQFIDYYKLTDEAHGDKQMMALLSNFARNNKY